MRSLIVCEGFDDVLIIGYFLHKTAGWDYDRHGKFSELYDLPKIDEKREAIEIYKKDNDILGIWAVGGKDSFDDAYKFVKSNNNRYPEEGIEKLFIVIDRDDNQIEESLNALTNKLKEHGLLVGQLVNRQQTRYTYEIDDEAYNIEVIPVIIPFDKKGALETVLMDGIAASGAEEQYIVNCANQYVDNIVASGKLENYLQHTRYILKARLSSTIAITNPDRSTNLFDKVLMSWAWEETETVKKHFGVINEFL